MTPGPNAILDRHGRPLAVLVWESGTRSAAEGRDLAAVARRLTRAELDHWQGVFTGRGMTHEAGILSAELDGRDPHRKQGTLWEFLDDDTIAKGIT